MSGILSLGKVANLLISPTAQGTTLLIIARADCAGSGLANWRRRDRAAAGTGAGEAAFFPPVDYMGEPV